jgi:uncharacterized membrane protein
MSDTSTVEVFVAAFATEEEAGEALDDFQQMDKEGSLELLDAAVIVHSADGRVHFKETRDPSVKKWAAGGAIVGGVVGLIFPPAIIATAAIGAGAGGIWGKLSDKGFKDEDLKSIGESLPPGSSAIIAVAEDHMVERLQQGLDGYRKIARHAMSAEASAQLIAEIDKEVAATDGDETAESGADTGDGTAEKGTETEAEGAAEERGAAGNEAGAA